MAREPGEPLTEIQQHVAHDNHKGGHAMRLHCFDTWDDKPIYVNLDAIDAMFPNTGHGLLVYAGGCSFRIKADIDDVLALIEGKRDTREKDLAKSNDEAIAAAVQRIRNRTLAEYDYTPDAREFEARIDEVEWIIANWNKFKPADLFEYALRRHAELIGLKRKAVA